MKGEVVIRDLAALGAAFAAREQEREQQEREEHDHRYPFDFLAQEGKKA